MTHRKIGYFDVDGSCYLAKPGRWRGKYTISEDGEELTEHLCKALHENEEDACAEGLQLGVSEAKRLLRERGEAHLADD